MAGLLEAAKKKTEQSQAAKITVGGSGAGVKASAKTWSGAKSIVCSACGLKGHTKSNKKCKYYSKPGTKSAESKPVVKTEGKKLKFSLKNLKK
jgi:hypothetical protein